eukprot:s805_g4.t1
MLRLLPHPKLPSERPFCTLQSVARLRSCDSDEQKFQNILHVASTCTQSVASRALRNGVSSEDESGYTPRCGLPRKSNQLLMMVYMVCVREKQIRITANQAMIFQRLPQSLLGIAPPKSARFSGGAGDDGDWDLEMEKLRNFWGFWDQNGDKFAFNWR